MVNVMFVYNSKVYMDDSLEGIQRVITFDSEEEFVEEMVELESNLDTSYWGIFDNVESINGEFAYQGFSLLDVKKMNLAMYGNVIDVLEHPDTKELYLFTAAR